SSETFPITEKSYVYDEALLDLLGVPAITKPEEAFAHAFMLTCAICNTVIPEATNMSPIGVRFEGASPDEEALVETAARAGYILVGRNANYVTLRISRSTPERKAQREWHEITFKVLDVNEFTSERKRMSVLVQMLKVVETDNGDTTHVPDENGSMLLVKGADDVVMECSRGVEGDSSMAVSGLPVQDVRETTVTHIHEFASAGHRTLMLAV
ncbi:hypothetical protein FOZ63_018146, partial [Perkinsus olseni]